MLFALAAVVGVVLPLLLPWFDGEDSLVLVVVVVVVVVVGFVVVVVGVVVCFVGDCGSAVG